MNTARNLLRYLTVEETGPKLPGVSVRVFRRKLRQIGPFFAKTRQVLTAERPKPYSSRWRVSYCSRRVGQLEGGLPTRLRIWADATFVNKWSTGCRSWITRDTADGDEVPGANKGGRGERFTLLHAFADYVDDDGSHRAQFTPGALEWSRGVAVDSSCFLPWFERVLAEGRSLFGGVAFKVHLDNSMVHLYSSDFNPRETRHRRADLLQEAISVCDAMGGGGGGRGDRRPTKGLPFRRY